MPCCKRIVGGRCESAAVVPPPFVASAAGRRLCRPRLAPARHRLTRLLVRPERNQETIKSALRLPCRNSWPSPPLLLSSPFVVRRVGLPVISVFRLLVLIHPSITPTLPPNRNKNGNRKTRTPEVAPLARRARRNGSRGGYGGRSLGCRRQRRRTSTSGRHRALGRRWRPSCWARGSGDR